MKIRLFMTAFLIFAAIYCLYAQEIVVTSPQLKAVVLEEYTGMNCPYCPQGHTVAESILNSNPGKVSVIAVHQGGFATPDEGQPDFRTSFGNSLAGQTNLEGYPSGTINRHYFPDLSTSGGTALNRGDWEEASDRILSEESYLNLGVMTNYDAETRELNVNVEAYYVQDLPFGVNSNFFQIAVTESNVIAYQAGASSSYNHKHILRHLITDQWGDEITEIEAGTIVNRTYSYTLPEEWVAENCEIVAFMTESHQEIITGVTVPLIDGQSNGVITPDYSRLFTDVPVAVGEESVNSEFVCTLINGFDSEQDFVLTLTNDAPEDWTVSFVYNEITYSETADITLISNQIANVVINVVPGQTSGVAKCVLTLQSIDFPEYEEKVSEVFVVSGVNNLIVNGSGTNSGVSSYEFEHYYKDALINAGCETVGAIPGYAFEQAVDFGALENVNNLFLNIGGTTPVLTLGQVNAIRDFIDEGGNLFVAGQDFGRDIMGTGSSSGSMTHKTFFQNYMSALYLNDGDASNNSIMSVNTDSVFGYIPGSALIDAYDGTFDPDAVKKYTYSTEIFHYPSGKAGGLRAYKGTARIVYLAFGLEQVQNEDTRNDIMDRTFRWFEGWEGTNCEMIYRSQIDIYPNPASDYLKISGLENNSNYTITDITGKIVKSGTICLSEDVIISDLKSGLYFIEISYSNKNILSKFTKL
ncbi:MAG TPA: Omp28-related outer membrane protein [Bacteroidales bacterium]|nr:Omp28-related outer membrane protein [Bacteroidales bacterium]